MAASGMTQEEMQRMIQDMQQRLQEQERKDQQQRNQFGVSGDDLNRLGDTASDFGGESTTTQMARGMTGAPQEIPLTVQGTPPPTARFPDEPPPAPPMQSNPSGVAAFAQLTPEEMARFRRNPY